MSFVSVSFLFLYLLVLALRFTIGREKRGRFYFASLILLSLLFYAWEIPHYIVLILLSCLIDHVAANRIHRTPSEKRSVRRLYLALSVVGNLGILGLFKYSGFLLDIFASIGLPLASEPTHTFWTNVVLPIGISFYTFQSMSYTIDVYRGRLQPVGFSRLLLYVAFFPQLVAGPIVRAGQFLYQLERRRKVRAKIFFEGGYLILRGLFLKIVVADNLGTIVDRYWSLVAAPDAPALMTLSLTFFFSCQILCDFMGYTDIARGVAYQLGFRLPVNFNAPYLANTFSGFWRRWHITLSQWMRDYLYLALGGSRKGRVLTLVNLFVVMVVAGLWHGAAMNFLLWGAILGGALVLERVVGVYDWVRGFEKSGLRMNAGQSARVLLWFLVVQATWLASMAVFRSSSGAESLVVLDNLWHGISSGIDLSVVKEKDLVILQLGWFFTLPVVLIHARAFLTEWAGVAAINLYERALYAGVMLFALLTLYATQQPFIYFQF